MGPLWLFGDYANATVNRPGNLKNVKFNGWHTQAAYLLTGETREYSVKNGKFGKVVPNDKCIGAWEVAMRYSVINLNDGDIIGGRQTNSDFSLGWFATEQLRFILNYDHARIHPNSSESNQNIRKLNIIGLRGQLTF
jgi:phosphate-selective porin OprO and OprP